MEEVNDTICKSCRLIKKRQMNGYFPNGKDKIWVDPVTRGQWNGRTCPECVKHSTKDRMRAKRNASKSNSDTST